MKQKRNKTLLYCAILIGSCMSVYTADLTAQGCPGLGSITLNVEDTPNPTLSAPVQLCSGSNGTVSVNEQYDTYFWNTGGTNQSISISNPGVYAVTVTNAGGCSGTATVNVGASPPAVPVITQNSYTCNGQITLNAGGGFTSYSWSNGGGNAQTATFTTSGTYSVTVTNAAGCTGTGSFNLNIPPPPVVNITGNLDICTGESTTLSATTGFSAYAWNVGGNTANLTVSSAGTYTVTVTDNFGCTDTESATVIAEQSPAPSVANAQVCPGASVTLSVANAPFQSYSWSTGSVMSTTTATTPGTYSVTVTAANGCIGSTTATVTLLPAPAPNITAAAYACNGQLILDAGAGFNTYEWSTGSNGASITVNASGNYTVIVSNAQGCTATDTYFADIPAPPVVAIAGNNTICPGESTLLSASPGFSNYLWSTGSNNASIDVSTAGNYTVIATDPFGCTATDELSVSVLVAPTPNISGPSQICATGSATFSVPGAFTAFNWSTGDITPTITVNTANTYTVTVTSANGCTGTDAQTLIVANNLQPQITELAYACNGQITLDAGAGFSSYNWSGGQNTQEVTVNAAGIYDVTVSDAGGCTGTASAIVSIPSPPMVDISGNSTICAGAATTLTATAGLNSYIWNTGQVGDTITVNTAGLYSVTATDVQGCTVVDEITINSLPAPQPVITGPSVICTNSNGTLSLSAMYSQYNWSTGNNTPAITITSGNTYSVTVTDAQGCTGTDSQVVTEASGLAPVVSQLPYACDGTQTLSAGAGFNSYLWSGGQNTETVSVDTSGVYTVTVTDATGCSGTGTLAVTIPVAPEVIVSGNNSFCQNENTVLTATPGFVSYIWSNGQNTETVTVNQSDNIAVTVTDNLGCTDTASITVTAQPLPQPQIAGPAVICQGSSATLSVNPVYIDYQWSTGAPGSSITVNAANTYAITVTDTNGCTGVDDASVAINPNPAPVIFEAPYNCDGQITLSTGPGFNAYAWSGPGGFVSNIPQPTVNTSGDYNITVTDANGCTGTATLNTIVPVLNQVTISGDTQLCPSETSTLMADAGFDNYFWSTGSLLQMTDVTASGTYSVTATDALGCTSTATIDVQALTPPTPAIAGSTTICGSNPISLTVTGGAFSDILWSNTAVTPVITVNTAGTYSVTVTDVNGCSGSALIDIQQGTSLSTNISTLPYACNGQITLDAGLGFDTYTWSNGSNLQSTSVTQSGSYVVTVTDSGGCSGTATIQVDIPTTVAPEVYTVPALCPGESITSAVINAQDFVQFNWNTGETTSSIDGVTGGQAYSVTVTDANGCTQSAGFTIPLAPSPTPVVVSLPYACDGQITLDAGTGFDTYTWSGPNGFTFGNQQPIVSTPGTYSVTVTNSFSCTGTGTAQVVIPVNPVVTISGATAFCPGSGITLTANAGFTVYSWSNGSNLPATDISAAGTYSVTVTDAAGCTAAASTEVQTLPPATVSIAGSGTLCGGSSITLTTSGSDGIFAWSNGTTGTPLTVTQAGTYTVTVTDTNGCTAADSETVLSANPVGTTINLTSCRPQEAGTQTLTLVAANGCDSIVTIITTYQPTIPGLALVMDETIEASIGQEITLNVVGNFVIDSVSFLSPFTLSCMNCVDPVLTVTASGFIQVTAFDAGGCSASEALQILVRKTLNVYVPNAFRPGSGLNGYFSVFSGPEISSVRNFNVFDRWGNALFSRDDMPTNDPTVGWDGSFRNKQMQPGVYVYYFEVLLADGSKEVYSGEVTIVE